MIEKSRSRESASENRTLRSRVTRVGFWVKMAIATLALEFNNVGPSDAVNAVKRYVHASRLREATAINPAYGAHFEYKHTDEGDNPYPHGIIALPEGGRSFVVQEHRLPEGSPYALQFFEDIDGNSVLSGEEKLVRCMNTEECRQKLEDAVVGVNAEKRKLDDE